MVPTHHKIYNCIVAVQNESSSNKKKDILKNYFNDDLECYNFFTTYLDYVYNEVRWSYNIRQIPDSLEVPSNMGHAGIIDLFSFAPILGMGTGGIEDKQSLNDFLLQCDNELKYLVELMLDRSINAGIERKTLVDCYPTLEHLISPYMRCEKEDCLEKRIEYPAIAQIKADGLFINCFTGNNANNQPTRFITRYGNEAIIGGGLQEVISILSSTYNMENKVLMGELLVKDKDTILPRQVGNGRINSYLLRFNTIKTYEKNFKKSKTEKAKEKLKSKLEESKLDWKNTEDNLLLKYWDCVTEEEFKNKNSNKPYLERVNYLTENLKPYFESNDKKSIRLIPIDSRVVHNRNDINLFYEEVLKKGEEGLVIKNFKLLWKHGTARDGMIKMKDFKECDLKIIGFNPGEGEYIGGIGSLICESSDRLLMVDPSSGLSMEQRGLERVDLNDSSKGWKPIDGFDMNQYTGKIIALKYNELMSPNDKGIYSLFLPIIEEIRESFDKQEADDLEKIKNNKK